jgi:hypothetical protein
MIDFLKKQRASSLLGLSFDGNRLEGVVLRRTNGALAIQKTFEASLSLDHTNYPEWWKRDPNKQGKAAFANAVAR